MELIERYLQEIGRHLPANKRADILSELRSSLDDSLEAHASVQPSEEAVIQIIKEMGAPRKVAASYYPEGQYLIGPELFPFFQRIAGIVVAATVGGQLIAAIVSLTVSHQADFPKFLQILNSIPGALGSVVLVFAIMQWFNVHPDFEKKDFDPRGLPPLHKDKPIHLTEQIVNIILGTLFLAFLVAFGTSGGFTAKYGVNLLTDPVLDKYYPWIAVSIVLGILLDIVLLWRGHWEISTRIAKIGKDVFALVLLDLLFRGQGAWSNQMGIGGSLVEQLQFTNTPQGFQLIGMACFRLAFFVALVVIAVNTFFSIYRLIKHDLFNLRVQA
ncbi:MAG: hypothetical protein WBW94_04760 [Anaerolineales bacterium]